MLSSRLDKEADCIATTRIGPHIIVVTNLLHKAAVFLCACVHACVRVCMCLSVCTHPLFDTTVGPQPNLAHREGVNHGVGAYGMLWVHGRQPERIHRMAVGGLIGQATTRSPPTAIRLARSAGNTEPGCTR